MDTNDREVEASKRLAFEVELGRQKRKWTQLDLANRTGLSLTTIQSIENGRAGRSRKRTAVSLEEAFGWAEGSVARIHEGGRPVEGRDKPLVWTTVEEFVAHFTDDEESAARLMAGVKKRSTELGYGRTEVAQALGNHEQYESGATNLGHLDAALRWPPGYSAAIARGAEFSEGDRGWQLAEFDLDGDYPWKSADMYHLSPADELAISGSGLPAREQEIIARMISRQRRNYDEFVTVERDELIRDFRRNLE